MRNCYWCKKNIHKEANTSNWSIEIRDSIAVANKAFSLDTIAFFYFLKRTKAKTQKSANTTIHSFQFACPWHASFYMLPAISVKFTEDTLQQFGMWNNLCWAKQMVTFPPPPPPNWIFPTSFSGFCRSLKSTEVRCSPSLHGSCGTGIMLYTWANQSNQRSCCHPNA